MGKNIWIFNHYAGPPSISTGLRHYNFAKYLIEVGYRVTVFCSSAVHNTSQNMINDRSPYKCDDSEGVPFVYIKTRQYQGNGIQRVLNMLDYYRGLFKVTRSFENPDIILASSVHPLTCVAGIKISKKWSIPCICEIRDLWPESIVEYQRISRRNPVITALYWLEKWIYRNADRLVFTMEGGGQYIIEKGWSDQVHLDKIAYINNGVDLAEYDYNANHFQLKDEDLDNVCLFRVIYTGSLRYANNMNTFVEVAEIIQNMNLQDIKFLFWGTGDCVDEIQQAIGERGLKNIVLKGNIEKKYIPFILSRSHLNLEHGYKTNLTRFGFSPNKLFDYFASGTPILTTLPSPYDLIFRYGCGVSLEDQTPQAIAQTLVDIYHGSNAERQRMSEAARKAAMDYSYQALTEKLIEVIESC